MNGKFSRLIIVAVGAICFILVAVVVFVLLPLRKMRDIDRQVSDYRDTIEKQKIVADMVKSIESVRVRVPERLENTPSISLRTQSEHYLFQYVRERIRSLMPANNRLRIEQISSEPGIMELRPGDKTTPMMKNIRIELRGDYNEFRNFLISLVLVRELEFIRSFSIERDPTGNNDLYFTVDILTRIW